MNPKSGSERFLLGFFAVIYIGIVAVTAYSDTALPKIASMVIIPIAFGYFLVNPEFQRVKILGEYPLWMFGGIMMFYALSAVIWLINIEESMYIVTGSVRILYQIINVVVTFAAVYLFGSKTVDYTLYGVLIANTIRVIQGVLRYGIATTLSDILHTVKTGEQLGFMSMTEIHDVTYVYGFFILYYLVISDYSKKKKAFMISSSAFFIFMGFKRIIFASFGLGLVLLFVLVKLSLKLKKPYIIALTWGTALLSFFYVPFIRTGLFEYTMNRFNIETHARSEIYSYVAKIYDFTPTFIGHGVDYIMRYLKYLKTLKLKFVGSSLSYIHNDILVRYIEMGFWGFCGWLYGTCIFFRRWMHKNCGLMAAGFYAVLNTVHYVNFSVGNTNHSYIVRMILAVILTGTVCKLRIETPERATLWEEAK